MGGEFLELVFIPNVDRVNSEIWFQSFLEVNVDLHSIMSCSLAKAQIVYSTSALYGSRSRAPQPLIPLAFGQANYPPTQTNNFSITSYHLRSRSSAVVHHDCDNCSNTCRNPRA